MQARDQNQKPVQGVVTPDREQQLMLRLKRFALLLTGDDAVADDLVVALVWENVAAETENGAMSAGAREYMQFRRLFEIWEHDGKQKATEAHLFQPGYDEEAIRKGLDPSIAALLGTLPALHRAVLLLVYGEGFSYAATAKLLNITIEQLMVLLAQARGKFHDPVSNSAQ